MLLSFATQGQYDLAAAILTQAGAPAAALDPAACTVQAANPDLALLLDRIATGAVTILPWWNDSSDRWLLAANSRYAAERTFAHVHRFVLPSYASLPGGARFASFRPFAEEDSPLPAALAAGYAGYFEWRTPPSYRETVLRRLALWARLQAAVPSLTFERTPQYAEMLAQFQSALAVADWATAADALSIMRRLHLSSFDNLQFLRFELLARQGEWIAIWSDLDFTNLAQGSTPRTVRAAMIAAFHHTVLLPAEQAGDFDAVLARLREAQPRLGALLTGRFGLSSSAVVRVFAYQAAAAEDRTSLDQLLAISQLDEGTRAILERLHARLPAPASVPPLSSPTERLRRAMHLRDYDAAVQAAGAMDDRLEQAHAFLRIALRHPDAVAAALAAYEALSPEEQVKLEDEEPLLNQYLERILDVSRTPRLQINTWVDWFIRLAADPADAALEHAIDTLRQAPDDRLWSSAILDGTRQHLEAILVADAGLLHGRTMRKAVAALADQLLNDPEFPRDSIAYRDLYEALLNCMVLIHDVSATEGRKLLLLVDAHLRTHPAAVEAVANDLKCWFDHPSPALESLLLDGFDLLIHYGAQRGAIATAYRMWLTHLLDLPTTANWDHASQQVWLSIGEWLQSSHDLLYELRQRLTTAAAAAPNPLQRLPQGCRIAVFTLNPSAARRAGDLIQMQNPTVAFEICADTVLTGQAKHLAQWADVPVIVATCVTHALTYGIGPSLRHAPVYPVSQGTVSIMRALEEYAASSAR